MALKSCKKCILCNPCTFHKYLQCSFLQKTALGKSVHQRKALMADLSDAFVALPGGYGTADELFEILTWAQLGIHAKPIALLNVAGFFAPLLAWLDHMVREDFLRRKHWELLLV